jgi:hypothetical protein
MAQKHRVHNQKSRRPMRHSQAAAPSAPRVIPERKPPVVYGQAFIVMEDETKRTFEYQRGAWVPYELSIAECRRDCLVKELPQKVNRMTRYEVRRPVAAND